jgi:alpha,alpha-trehalase
MTPSLEMRWQSLDAEIASLWDGELRRAGEREIRDPAANRIWFTDEEHRKREARPGQEEGTLLHLPHPYVSAGGSESAFPEMYCWDIPFINKALLLHGRGDIVRYHLLNHLYLIERFGMVLTGNRTYYLTRSQTPLLAQSVREYYAATGDRDMLMLAYPRLRREYETYWMAPHHQTPVGLATNRDLGDPHLRPELAAEAESLDFTAIYAGDIRKTTPLLLNAALVRYERTMAWMARELRLDSEARPWNRAADQRIGLINECCWDAKEGFFFEYRFDERRRLPFWSLSAYWMLWSGAATEEQASRLASWLPRFEQKGGLSQTDVAYPSPHPEFAWVQWGHPAGWPPMQMATVEGLLAYGFTEEAERIASKYLKMQMEVKKKTGKFWEKYNVVEASQDLPRERTPNVPLRGWSAASPVWLGHVVYRPDKIEVKR